MSDILNTIENAAAAVDQTIKTEAPVVIKKASGISAAWHEWSQKHPNAAHAIVFGVLGFVLGTLVHF